MLTLIGIAMGFSALRAQPTAEDTIYWYERDPVNNTYSSTYTLSPPEGCGQNPLNPICALGFLEEKQHVDDSMIPEAESIVNRVN